MQPPSERTFSIFFPPMCQRPELGERKGCIYQTHVSTENLPTVFGYLNFLSVLGPGRPSAGGPRMDRRAVTSLGVVKISRLQHQC